jgi:oligopeptide/dipeptide ABC transporter ATP-binding protein
MELTDVHELFRNPLHPYTHGLLQSLPVAKGVALKPITGFVPNPENLPAGCKFSDRCYLASDECRKYEPELVEISENHHVRCIKIRQ